MKRVLITLATVGILAPTAWVAGANAQYGAPAPAGPGYAPAPAYALRQPLALLEDMPVAPTVALLVSPIALRTMALPLRSTPVVRPSPLARVGSPMPLLLEHMPHNLPSRTNGTPLPAQ